MRPFPGARISVRALRKRTRARELVAVAALVAFAAAADAAEPIDEEDRWVPSFGVFFDMLGQKADGSVTTGQILGPPLPVGCDDTIPSTTGLCDSNRVNPSQILADSAGNDTSVAPLVGAALELMTPSLLDAFVRPRLFVRGEAAAAFAFERNLAGIESPDDFQLPAGLRVPPGIDPAAFDIEELSVRGQGSRTRIQVRPTVLSAGGGIALSFDVFDRRIRIKPSLEYLHYELDLIGVVHRAVKLRTPAGANDLSGFRLLSLTSVEQRSYDGIGPGLELEADATRLGPLVSSVYIMGRGYHLFGDLDTELSATNEFGETASWTFEPDPWVWRAGVGFRLRWSPEE